jgi:predicted phage terminase large subunit-like protein
MIIKPQKVQELALRSTSKIVLFGGAKGGGKSFALRLAPLYNIHLENYHAVIFRRTLSQCKKPGGLWDKSYEVYECLNGVAGISNLKWTFPNKSTIQFSHLQKNNSYRDWFGTETAFFGFDQLEEFTQEQFLNILGCMRTVASCETQIFATMNPDNNSWVRNLVDYWIAKDGYVDPEKNNTKINLAIENNNIKVSNFSTGITCSYFSTDIWDNKILLEKDPNYLVNLKSQSLIERERYLGIKGRGGNWNIKPSAGKIFKSSWFNFTNYNYELGDRLVRFWDFASTLVPTKRGDYIADCLMCVRNNSFIILEAQRRKLNPVESDKLVFEKAIADNNKYRNVMIRWHKDPAQAGVKESFYLRQLLSNFDNNFIIEKRDKVSRSLALSRSLEIGQTKFMLGEWKECFIELENFPDVEHDDLVDCITGAFNFLNDDSQTKLGKFSY